MKKLITLIALFLAVSLNAQIRPTQTQSPTIVTKPDAVTVNNPKAGGKAVYFKQDGKLYSWDGTTEECLSCGTDGITGGSLADLKASDLEVDKFFYVQDFNEIYVVLPANTAFAPRVNDVDFIALTNGKYARNTSYTADATTGLNQIMLNTVIRNTPTNNAGSLTFNYYRYGEARRIGSMYNVSTQTHTLQVNDGGVTDFNWIDGTNPPTKTITIAPGEKIEFLYQDIQQTVNDDVNIFRISNYQATNNLEGQFSDVGNAVEKVKHKTWTAETIVEIARGQALHPASFAIANTLDVEPGQFVIV